MYLSYKKITLLVPFLLASRHLLADCLSFPEDLQSQCLQISDKSTIRTTAKLREKLAAPKQNIELGKHQLLLESELTFTSDTIFISPAPATDTPALIASGPLLMDIHAKDIFLSGVRLVNDQQLIRYSKGQGFGLFESTLEITSTSNTELDEAQPHIDFSECQGHIRLINNALLSLQSITRMTVSTFIPEECSLTFAGNTIDHDIEIRASGIRAEKSDCNLLTNRAVATCPEPPFSGYIHFFRAGSSGYYCGSPPIMPVNCDDQNTGQSEDNTGQSEDNTGRIVGYSVVGVLALVTIAALFTGIYAFSRVVRDRAQQAATRTATGAASRRTTDAEQALRNLNTPLNTEAAVEPNPLGHTYETLEPNPLGHTYEALEPPETQVYNTLFHY